MAATGIRLFKSIFIFFNLCVIGCYLIVCVLPYINTGSYWFLALPGLIFPLIVFALLFFIVIWAFAKSKWFWLSLVVLLLGSQQIFAVFGFHPSKAFEMEKPGNTLRVFQWNVSGWGMNNKAEDERKSSIQSMLEIVKKQNADILCFEEFAERLDAKDGEKNIEKFVKLGYPYYYFIRSGDDKLVFEAGVSIFSKYPIVDSAKFDFGKNSFAEHMIYVDVKVKDKIFRIITIHLQSVRFEIEDYESLSEIKHTKEEGLKDSRTILAKLKRGYTSRYKQAVSVREQVKDSPYPVILCGDFNDVPNSNTYFKVKGNLQDAFLKTGFFIGRTFRFISPTLRIDYILSDKRFSVQQSRVIHVPYSDHYPVEADLGY